VLRRFKPSHFLSRRFLWDNPLDSCGVTLCGRQLRIPANSLAYADCQETNRTITCSFLGNSCFTVVGERHGKLKASCLFTILMAIRKLGYLVSVLNPCLKRKGLPFLYLFTSPTTTYRDKIGLYYGITVEFVKSKCVYYGNMVIQRA
jgi:hypothetical protein